MITHPDKVIFPDDGITKGELATYYEMVAPLILPHLRGRPVTMERFPQGIDAKGFIQKSVTRGFPEWLPRVEVPKKGGTVFHPLVDEQRALEWMANQNCVTPHVWTARVPDLEHPDLCIFDLDPAVEDPDRLRDAALQVRDLLAELGLASYVKTSGSKGYHVAVPLDGSASYHDAGSFGGLVGSLLVARDPDHLTQEFAKADRGGRIYLDTDRNRPGATFAAAYAVRARAGAPVSAPCTWDEVERGEALPRTFSLRTVQARVQEIGDLWASLAGQPLGPAIDRARGLRGR